MSDETWLTIPETDGLYEASSLGRIRSKDRTSTVRCKCGEVIRAWSRKGRVLKGHKDAGGYLAIRICVDGKQKQTSVHRLVASAFHGQGGNLIVNHIDGNKTNNRPENLEWCTHSENLVHAGNIGLRSDLKPVIGTPVAGGPVVRFPSISAAARHVGAYSHANIASVASGKWKTAYGYSWKYEDELETA